jgi:CRP/FNR family cyclic AMP-dependent transcriptional regulator
MPRRATPTADPAELIARAPMTESLRTLAAMGVAKRCRAGHTLIHEGDTGDTLYIVLDGCLRAYSAASDGREITYGEYGPGEYVGEMGLDGGPRSADVEATVDSVVSMVTRATLERHLADDPAFAFELLAKVIRRARAATKSLKSIALNKVYGRLKDLLETVAVPQPDGTWLADPAPSHQEMASRLGCGREMVTRVLRDLETGGYVATGRRRLQLLKRLPDKW